MRKELDEWCFHTQTEDSEHILCRLLIAVDELRARLAPSKYPNIEISDEGYLWFNVETPKGTVRILAFPFGFKEFKEPSLAVSLPRKAKDVDSNLLNKLRLITQSITGLKTFAAFCTAEGTLKAYKQNKHPPLTFLWSLNELPEMKKKRIFLNYLGVGFPVAEKGVSEIERTLRKVLWKLEERITSTRE